MKRKEFSDVWDANRDGGGLMFVQDGKLEVWKPFWKLKNFWHAYQVAQKRADGPIVLHFRLATHGRRDHLNTHPHILAGGRAALVHNGILPVLDSKDDSKSDTVQWAEYIFGELEPEVLVSASLRSKFEPIIRGNKLVFMDDQARVSIMNEELGHWDEGKWYSNLQHRWDRYHTFSKGFGYWDSIRRCWVDSGKSEEEDELTAWRYMAEIEDRLADK